MGILGKLAFWKKKDEFGDISKDLGLGKDSGLGEMSPDLGLGLETTRPDMYPSYQQPSQPQPPIQQSFPPFQQQPYGASSMYNDQNYVTSKNIEVISSKLDALRATLDSVNQRLANIEAIARGEQEDKRRRYY